MNPIPTPTTTLLLDEINPASFDFWLRDDVHGAHLARREVIVMFTELLSRLPAIEATSPPERLRSNFIHGVKRLPAAFKPRA